MKFGKGCEILWKDRKRIMGMPISFTRYYVVKKEGEWIKFFRDKGLFNTVIDEVNLYRCHDVSLTVSLADKIFKTGTLEISSNNKTAQNFLVKNVANPYEVRDLISKLIELERKKRNVGITEFQ